MSNRILMFAKMQTEGRGTGLDKTAFHDAIVKRAAETRRSGETEAKAYTRYATETEDGRLLLAAYKAAPAPAPVFPVADDATEEYAAHGNPKDDAVRAILEGAKKVQEEAKTKSVVLSDAQAFDRYYNAPENRKAKAAYDRAIALWRVKSPQ
jgi:plasmid stability protein